MSPSLSDLNEDAIKKFPQGTTVRHKGSGVVALVGERRTRKDGGLRFDLLTDGGKPKKRIIRAGRLLAEWEIVPR